MVERAATQAADFGPEIPDSVFWFATKVGLSAAFHHIQVYMHSNCPQYGDAVVLKSYVLAEP